MCKQRCSPREIGAFTQVEQVALSSYVVRWPMPTWASATSAWTQAGHEGASRRRRLGASGDDTPLAKRGKASSDFGVQAGTSDRSSYHFAETGLDPAATLSVTILSKYCNQFVIYHQASTLASGRPPTHVRALPCLSALQPFGKQILPPRPCPPSRCLFRRAFPVLTAKLAIVVMVGSRAHAGVEWVLFWLHSTVSLAASAYPVPPIVVSFILERMQLPSSVVEHLRGNAGRRAASSFDNVEITIENDTGRATIAVQHANYIELVATGTPTAGRNPLPAYAAPAVSFTAGNKTLTAHKIKFYVRQLLGERTVAALIKRPKGAWVLKKAADVNVPVAVYRLVRRLRGLSVKFELNPIFLGNRSTSFRNIMIMDLDNLSIVLRSIGGGSRLIPCYGDNSRPSCRLLTS